MNTAVRTVTVIPPSINPMTHLTDTPLYKLRVAAYARVSTDSDEQFTSYEAQIDYYTQYIQRNPEWTFVKVYTDEGISGTNTKHRVGFNEMIADAISGKIDLIVTKSVSRFARSRAGRGGHCPPDLYSIHGGVDAGGHCKGTDSRWDSDSIEKTTLADQYSGKHPSKREIQGCCTPSKMLHGRFPHEKEKGQ